MKYIQLLLFLLVCSTVIAQPGDKARVRISIATSGPEESLYLAQAFEGALFNEFKLAYPCLAIVTDDLMRVGLDQLREMGLSGAGDDDRMKEFSQNIATVDYYLYITGNVMEGGLSSVSAIFQDPKKGEDLSWAYFSGDYKAFMSDPEQLRSQARKVTDGLANYEICPFKGPIKIEVKTDLDVDLDKSYPVTCNGEEREYRMKYTEHKHTTNTWNFEKTSRVYAQAFVDYNINETDEKIIEDGCYSCPSGKTRRYFRETRSLVGKFDKVSSESQWKGMPINDARISIQFNEDGTFTMGVDAATDQSEVTVTRQKYAESWCDTNNEPQQVLKEKADYGLKYIFGPYKGKASDESLNLPPTQFVRVDPVSNEKTTYTVSFDLKKVP